MRQRCALIVPLCSWLLSIVLMEFFQSLVDPRDLCWIHRFLPPRLESRSQVVRRVLRIRQTVQRVLLVITTRRQTTCGNEPVPCLLLPWVIRAKGLLPNSTALPAASQRIDGKTMHQLLINQLVLS